MDNGAETYVLCLADARIFCWLDRKAKTLFNKVMGEGDALRLLKLAHAHAGVSMDRDEQCYAKWRVSTIFMQLLQGKQLTKKFFEKLGTDPEFYIPESYPCPGGMPDFSKFPSIDDVIAAGLATPDLTPAVVAACSKCDIACCVQRNRWCDLGEQNGRTDEGDPQCDGDREECQHDTA